MYKYGEIWIYMFNCYWIWEGGWGGGGGLCSKVFFKIYKKF